MGASARAAPLPLVVKGVGSILPARIPLTLASDSACLTIKKLFRWVLFAPLDLWVRADGFTERRVLRSHRLACVGVSGRRHRTIALP